ncbi:hypothetical protein GR7B_00034 [Vibrio phage vB_VcorM_GR7B]|nr:hypothetical protein GR7B_00034 [Vibrio phage vB_VcorM_GR7B]
MQSQIGVHIGNTVVFVDVADKTQYHYTVEDTIFKAGTRKAKVRLDVVSAKGVVQTSNAITLPQNNTIVMGKLKLALRQTTRNLGVLHFMHPKWCRIDQDLTNFELSRRDKVDNPTRGEPEYKERKMGAQPVFKEPYGNQAKKKRNKQQTSGYVAAYGSEGLAKEEEGVHGTDMSALSKSGHLTPEQVKAEAEELAANDNKQ